MYKYLPLLLLTGCIETVEIPVQVNPFACVDGFKWTFEGEAMTNEQGAQLTCVNG